ncbi:hypothetical protein AaE_011936, partial [Aphanomyces astaci]
MNSTSLSDLDVDHTSSASVDRFLLEHGIEFSSSSMEEEKETSFSLQLTDSRLERDEPLTLDDFSPMRPSEATQLSNSEGRSSRDQERVAYPSSVPRDDTTSARAPSTSIPFEQSRDQSSAGMVASRLSTPSSRKSRRPSTASVVHDQGNDSNSTEASAVHPSTSSDSAWRPLNSLLAQHGFSPVELVPTVTGLLPKMDALYGVVHDLISQLERRGQVRPQHAPLLQLTDPC